MPIRWDKFTVKAQEAVQRANDLASEHGNPELQPVHLLAALLEDKEGIVPPVLEKIGIGPQAVLNGSVGVSECRGIGVAFGTSPEHTDTPTPPHSDTALHRIWPSCGRGPRHHRG